MKRMMCGLWHFLRRLISFRKFLTWFSKYEGSNTLNFLTRNDFDSNFFSVSCISHVDGREGAFSKLLSGEFVGSDLLFVHFSLNQNIKLFLVLICNLSVKSLANSWTIIVIKKLELATKVIDLRLLKEIAACYQNDR